MKTLRLVHITSWIAAAAIVNGACASTSPSKPVVTPPAPRVDPLPAGLEYALPKTTLVLDVQVERTSDSPGKYCDFLDLFFPELHLAAACQQKGSKPGGPLLDGKMKTTVTGYAVTLKGTPDATRKRSIDFDASWHVERTDSFTLTEGGALSGADMQRIDRKAEIVLSVLSNIAKIAGRFVFGAAAETKAPTKLPPDPAPWDTIQSLRDNYVLLSSERQDLYRDLWTNKSKRDQRARIVLATRSYQTTVNTLKELDAVASGGAGAVGAATLIPELRKQISDRLTDDFLGSKKKDSWNPIYEVTPDAATPSTTASSQQLFEITGCGVVKEYVQPMKNRLTLGCKLRKDDTVKPLAVSIRTSSNQVAARGQHADPAADPKDKDILYYVRPELVVLNLTGYCAASVTLEAAKDADSTLVEHSETDCNMADQPSLLAQWGTLHGIPKAGKDYSYSITMYEATGALKTVKLTSKAALDKGTVDSAFGVATTLLDAKDAADAAAKKKADEEAAKTDELTVLTRSRQILDEKAKIKKLCDELGLTNCEY